jgi:hypothetical protein
MRLRKVFQVSKKDEELLRLQKALKLREQDIGTIKVGISLFLNSIDRF